MLPCTPRLHVHAVTIYMISYKEAGEELLSKELLGAVSVCKWHKAFYLLVLRLERLCRAPAVPGPLGRRSLEAGEGRITASPGHIAVGASCVRSFRLPLQISLDSSHILQALPLLHQLPKAGAKRLAGGSLLSEQNKHLLPAPWLLPCVSQVYEADGVSEGHAGVPLLSASALQIK